MLSKFKPASAAPSMPSTSKNTKFHLEGHYNLFNRFLLVVMTNNLPMRSRLASPEVV
jgi:hypothetical protein